MLRYSILVSDKLKIKSNLPWFEVLVIHSGGKLTHDFSSEYYPEKWILL